MTRLEVRGEGESGKESNKNKDKSEIYYLLSVMCYEGTSQVFTILPTAVYRIRRIKVAREGISRGEVV